MKSWLYQYTENRDKEEKVRKTAASLSTMLKARQPPPPPPPPPPQQTEWTDQLKEIPMNMGAQGQIIYGATKKKKTFGEKVTGAIAKPFEETGELVSKGVAKLPGGKNPVVQIIAQLPTSLAAGLLNPPRLSAENMPTDPINAGLIMAGMNPEPFFALEAAQQIRLANAIGLPTKLGRQLTREELATAKTNYFKNLKLGAAPQIGAKAPEYKALAKLPPGTTDLTLMRFPNPKLQTQYTDLQTLAKDYSFDLTAVQGLKEDEYWIHLELPKILPQKFLDKFGHSEELVSKVSFKKGLNFGETVSTGADIGGRGFLPFKSLDDAERFLKQGDLSAIATKIEQTSVTGQLKPSVAQPFKRVPAPKPFPAKTVVSAKQRSGQAIETFLAEHPEMRVEPGQTAFPAPAAAKIPEVKPAAKEPWQMTKSEYIESYKRSAISGARAEGLGIIKTNQLKEKYAQLAPIHHAQKLKQALSEGKPVPSEVLADYPELAKGVKPAGKVSIPIMITKKMETNLKGLGYSQEAIDKMTPQVANDILAKGVKPAAPAAKVEGTGRDLIESISPITLQLDFLPGMPFTGRENSVVISELAKKGYRYLGKGTEVADQFLIDSYKLTDVKKIDIPLAGGRKWSVWIGKGQTTEAQQELQRLSNTKLPPIKNETLSPQVSALYVEKPFTLPPGPGLGPEATRPLTEAGKGVPPVKPPAPPIKPPAGKAPIPSPQDAQAKLIKGINESWPSREQLELAKSAALKRKIPGYVAARKGEGEAAAWKARGMLKGKLAEPEVRPELALNQAEKDVLFDTVKASNLQPLQKTVVDGALEKVLKGQIPTENELTLLESVFGGGKGSIVEAIEAKYPFSRKTWDMLKRVYINSLLSGPSTQLVNAITSSISSATSSAERLMAAGLDIPISRLQGRASQRFAGEAVADVFGTLQGLKEGVRASLKTLSTGQRIISATKSELPTRAVGKLGRIIDFPSNLMEATDTAIYGVNYRKAINAEAYRIAKQMETGNLAQVRNTTGISSLKIKELKELRAKPLAQRVAELVANPSDELKMRADKISRTRLWRDDPSKFMETVMKVRDLRVFGSVQPLIFITPFIRTPSQLLGFGLERSPLGLFNPKFIRAIMAKDPKTADYAARIILGSLTASAIALYVAEGNITGSPPTSEAERDRYYREGKRPWSVKIPGVGWVNYQRAEPFNQPFSQIAAVVDTLKGDPNADVTAQVGQIVSSIGKNFISQTYMSGLANTLDAIDDPERYAGSFLERTATGLMPYSSLLRTIARTTEPTVRQPEGILEAYKANIPGLSQTLPPKVTALGEEVKRTSPAWFPFTWSAETTTPVSQELERLKVNIGFVGEEIENVPLNDKEQLAYQKVAGLLTNWMLGVLVSNTSYQQADDNIKKKAIQKAVNSAREQAKALILQRIGEQQIQSRLLETAGKK